MKTLLASSLVLLAVLACGQSNSGVQVGQQPASTSVPPTTVIYHVGDVIQLSGHTIVLNSARITGGIVETNFTVENTGSQDVNVSSVVNFNARLPDGTNLEQELFNCPAGHLDGKVLPGDKLRGNICWKGVTADSVKLYYTPHVFGTGATVWQVPR
jgi:hypothetical protein